MIPARRKMAMKASSEATAQTSVCNRFTGTPSRAARSALSALALMAMPTLLSRRKTARPASASGATIIAMRSFPSNTTVPIENSSSNGAARRWPRRGKSTPHRRGRRIASALSTCDSPSDATVSSSRGALKNRRITASSTTAPRARAAITPTGTASRYGQPHAVINITMRTTGIVPMSAWAKLMNRFDR